MVHVNIEIPDDLHKKLKIVAVTDSTTIKAIVNEILVKAGESVGRK